MMRLFLCEARRQIRSIVGLCEEFGDQRPRAKRAHQNDFYKKGVLKIAPPPQINPLMPPI